MAMISLQGVYGTPVAVAMAASAGCKQFLVPAKVSARVRHLSPRRRASVVSAKHIGSYLDPTVADKEKEEAMEYRRMVFDHEDWIRHRSSSRHGRHLASIVSSRVIMALGPPVFSLTAFAAVVTFYNEALSGKILPAWLPLLHISSLPFSLTAPALALLLVFRTNASYARFDEARKAWGMNVNRSRDVCRQALTFMRSPADASKLQSFLHHAAAFPYALKSQVCEGDLEEDLDGLLDEAELASVLSVSHRPSYVFQVMSELVYSTSMSEMERASMDRNLTQFHDNVGTCERIFKTPIPLSYTRLTSRFLVIWHIALPLGLWDQCRWLTIPAVFFNAAALLCIEEVGVLIEEPFSTLALGSICNAIKNNIAALVEAHTDYAQKANRRSNFEAKL
jgi:putative membrane protein